jgi:hypothetical protein
MVSPISELEQEWKQLTLIDDIDRLVVEIRSDFASGLRSPKYGASNMKFRDQIGTTIRDVQRLYNVLEMAIKLLRDYPDENTSLIDGLEADLMGDCSQAKPFFKTESDGYVRASWLYELQTKPVGGVKVILQLLTDSLSYTSKTASFAALLLSAYRAFEVTVGHLHRLKSRLEWTVMYPDTFSKDSLKIMNVLREQGLDNVWQYFQTGLDNFRLGHLSDCANNFNNALMHLLRAAAKKYNYTGGGQGEHTIFLEKIGVIPSDMRQLISRFISMLAKFRKEKEPDLDEARLLVDQSFTLFGFLVPRMMKFEVKSGDAEEAKKEVKKYVRTRKDEEAKKRVKKARKAPA